MECRDGASNVHFLGIDVSMEALYMARTNVMKQCPQLSSKSIEMVCADYLEGLKQARARYDHSDNTNCGCKCDHTWSFCCRPLHIMPACKDAGGLCICPTAAVGIQQCMAQGQTLYMCINMQTADFFWYKEHEIMR